MQCGCAALIEALAANRKSSRLRALPRRTHHIPDLIPQDVLAAVQQPMVNGEDRRQTNSEQVTHHCGRQHRVVLDGLAELLHLFYVANELLCDPLVAEIIDPLPAPIERLLFEAGADGVGIAIGSRISSAGWAK
jgi:hypothetical protein